VRRAASSTRHLTYLRFLHALGKSAAALTEGAQTFLVSLTAETSNNQTVQRMRLRCIADLFVDTSLVMKSPNRTLIILTLIGLLPGAFALVVGIVAYIHGPDPGTRDPDPELRYTLPLLFFFLWTVFVVVVAAIAVVSRAVLQRSRFRRRMKESGVMDEQGRWICSPEEAERFQKIYG